MSDHEEKGVIEIGAIKFPADRYEKGQTIVVKVTIGPGPPDDPPDPDPD